MPNPETTFDGPAGEPIESTATPTTVADDNDTDETLPDDTAGLIAENQKYRKRAQTAETELQAVSERLEAAQRAQVTAYAAGQLSEPSDALSAALGGADLADLLDENGQVDREKVRATVAEMVAARPGLGTVPGASDPQFPNVGQGGSKRTNPRSTSWAGVLTK